MPVPAPLSAAPIARTLIRDQVSQQLRTAILDGTLTPGEQLHDDGLSRWLGASRTPIREAIGELVTAGMIVHTPQRHTFVASPDPNGVVGVLHTIGVIMSGVVRLTVPVLSDEQRADTVLRLTSEINALTQSRNAARAVIVLAAGIVPSYDAWLHACPNQLLADSLRPSVHGLAFHLRVSTLPAAVPMQHLRRELTALRKAVQDQDPFGAAHAMERIHLLDRPDPTAPDAGTTSSERAPAATPSAGQPRCDGGIQQSKDGVRPGTIRAPRGTHPDQYGLQAARTGTPCF